MVWHLVSVERKQINGIDDDAVSVLGAGVAIAVYVAVALAPAVR